MPGKDVLITGGFGNLGSWLTTAFVENGYTVTVLASRKKNFLDNLNFRLIECDISDTTACEQALASAKFEYIIHTASVNDTFVKDYARKAIEVNAFGTRNLLQAVDKTALRNFIYLSTFHVYGLSTGTITEETPLQPRHDYATTHLFGEYYVRQFYNTHSLPHTILRLTNSYGCPKEKNSSKWYLVLNDLARMAFEEKKIVLQSNGQAQRDFIWMGDVCRAIAQLTSLEKAPNDVYNLSSGVTSRLLDVARAVQQAYLTRYGQELPIEVNAADTSRHTETLLIRPDKLARLINLQPENRFEYEADRIFQFLERAPR